MFHSLEQHEAAVRADHDNKLSDRAVKVIALARYAREAGMTQTTIERVPAGEFIKRQPDAVKVYRATGYDRSTKKYHAEDCDDISRDMAFKKGTLVYIGFTY